MKYLIRISFIVAVWICVGGEVFSQGTAILSGQDTMNRVITTAVPFLTIAPDARSGALGDAGAATTPDAASAHYNPAKFAFIKNDYGMSMSYTPWLGNIINDMSISYLSGYYRLNRERTLAMSLRYFDLGDIVFTDILGQQTGQFNPREFAIDATYSQRLTEAMSLGGSLRFIHSNLTGNAWNSTNDAQAGTSIAADVGWYYNKDFMLSNKNTNLAVGVAVTNIGQKMTYSDDNNEEFIPTNLRVGTAFKTNLDPYNTISLIMDFNKLMVPTPPVYELNDDGSVKYDSDGNQKRDLKFSLQEEVSQKEKDKSQIEKIKHCGIKNGLEADYWN